MTNVMRKDADKRGTMKVLTAVLRGNGKGSSVLIDDEPVEGVKSVKVEQVVGSEPKVIIELAAPIVVVKVETDDVTMTETAANEEGKPE